MGNKELETLDENLNITENIDTINILESTEPNTNIEQIAPQNVEPILHAQVEQPIETQQTIQQIDIMQTAPQIEPVQTVQSIQPGYLDPLNNESQNITPIISTPATEQPVMQQPTSFQSVPIDLPDKISITDSKKAKEENKYINKPKKEKKPINIKKLIPYIIGVVLLTVIGISVFFGMKMFAADPRTLLVEGLNNTQKYKYLKEPFASKIPVLTTYTKNTIISNKETTLTSSNKKDILYQLLNNNFYKKRRQEVEINTIKDSSSDETYTTFKNKESLKTLFSAEAYLKGTELYYKIPEALNNFVKINLENDSLLKDPLEESDIQYLIDKAITDLPNHVNKDSFVKSKQTIKQNGTSVKVTKNTLKFNKTVVNNVAKGIYKNLLKDEKASEILSKIIPDYKEYVPEIKFESKYDFLEISTYSKSKKVLKTDIDITYTTNEGYNPDLDEPQKIENKLKIEFHEDLKDTINITNNETKMELRFTKTSSGYDIELDYNKVTGTKLTIKSNDKELEVSLKLPKVLEQKGYLIDFAYKVRTNKLDKEGYEILTNFIASLNRKLEIEDEKTKEKTTEEIDFKMDLQIQSTISETAEIDIDIENAKETENLTVREKTLIETKINDYLTSLITLPEFTES